MVRTVLSGGVACCRGIMVDRLVNLYEWLLAIMSGASHLAARLVDFYWIQLIIVLVVLGIPRAATGYV